MEPSQTVLIVGLGELGGLVLELLVRSPSFRGRIIACDINEDLALRKINSAVQGAILWGTPAQIETARLDLRNVDETAEKLAAWRPSLIFNAATLASWWLRDLLPEPVKAKLHALGAGSGIWSASHATLAYDLMRAVRMSGIRTTVVNSAYPDAVNPALSHAGLAPALGIGNGGLLIAPFRQLAARRLGVSPCRISAYLVAHHFHAYNILVHGTTKDVPFYARVLLDGDDVTQSLDLASMVATVPDLARIPAAAGATWIVAASAVRTLIALLDRSGEVVHAPGPLGLVGGYPIAMTPSGPKLALPADISETEAVALNWGGQRAEGIESIEADGTIVLTDVARDTLKDVFDFTCSRYPLADCHEIARELAERLRRLGERHGLALKVH
jgi:hypothetical protein